jgi:integrase/recombinase XerD
MTQPMTPLRQRMLDDMKLRNLAAGTRQIYVRSVTNFSAFHGRSPDQLTLEDVRQRGAWIGRLVVRSRPA